MFSKLQNIDEVGINVVTSDDFDSTIEEINKSISSEIFIGVVEGSRDIDSLFESFKDAFFFPDYFGGNWVAFDECLNDLDWLDAEGYVLIIKNSEVLPELKEAFGLLIDTLSNAVYEWTKGRQNDGFPTKPTLFNVVFLVAQENKDSFNKSLQDSNRSKVKLLY